MSSSPAAISHSLTSSSSFSSVSRLAPNGKKASGLFNFIERKQVFLRSEGYHIVQGMNSDHHAFFITMTAAPLLRLRGCHLVENHLTVDKFYRSEQSPIGIRGYLYAHYTARYRHEDGRQITVHAYFNQSGKLVPVQDQLRKLITARVKTQPGDIDLELTPEEKDQIKKNLQEASALLQKFLNHKDEEYEKAVSEAARLDIELIKLSTKLEEAGIKEIYMELAKNFLEQIHLINLYNDGLEYDARGDRIKQSLTFLRNAGVTISADLLPTPIKEEKEEAEIESVEAFGQPVAIKPSTPSKIDLFSLIEKQEQELDRLMAISNQDTVQKIKILELARDLQDSLLALNFREGLTKKEAVPRQKLMIRIKGKIKGVPNFSELIEKAYRKGDLESFKLLFSFERYGATCLKSLQGILMLLVMQKGEDPLCKSLIAICDYMFENSQNYRQLMRFSVRKKKTIGLMINTDKAVSVSLLIKAMQMDNFPVFNMLLRHDYNPNYHGLAYESYLISTVRACIAYSGNDKEAIYLKLLLEKEASVNSQRMPLKADLNSLVGSDNFQKEMLAAAKKDIKYTKEILATKQTLSDSEKRILGYAINGSSDLVYACVIGHFAAIPMLQAASNSSSLFDLTLAMSSLRCRKEFKSIQRPCMGNFGLSFLSTTNEQVIEEFCQLKSAFHSSSQMQIVVFATEQATANSIVAMQGLYEAFIEKYRSSPLEINPAIDQLVQFLKDSLTIQEKNLATHYYQAALSLIVQKGLLTQEDVVQIMQLEQYMVTLYLGGGNPNKDKAMTHFERLFKAAALLGYADVLRDHLLLKLAKSRLDNFFAAQKKLLVNRSSSADVSAPAAVRRIMVPVSVNPGLLAKKGVVDLKLRWEKATLMPTGAQSAAFKSRSQKEDLAAIGDQQALPSPILYSCSYPISEPPSSDSSPTAHAAAAISTQPAPPPQAVAKPKRKKKNKNK